MNDTIKRYVSEANSSFRKAPRVIGVMAVVMLLMVSSTAVVVAQSETTQSDDFEGQSSEGWSGYDTYPEVVSTPSQVAESGDYSLYAQSQSQDEQPLGTISWESGPTLDTSEPFNTTATFRYNSIDDTAQNVRIGLASPNADSPGENAFIIFDQSSGITYLGTYATAPSGGGSIANDYEDSWVRVRLQSDGNGVVEATVWELGTSEPSPQLSRNFSGTQGNFGFNVGTSPGGQDDREAWLDSVVVEGTAIPSDEELRIDTRDLYFPGNTHEYSVFFDMYNTTVEHNVSTNVTSNSTVTSENTSVLSVNQGNNTLSANDDSNVSQVVNVTAEYNGYTTVKQVVVANPTMENLELLPTGLWRTYALLKDDTIFALLIAAFFSVAAARFAGAFAGLATAEMVIVVGWLAGYVGLGIAMVSVFMALFIGLNLAANIDYSVTRFNGR